MNKKRTEKTISMLENGSTLILLLGILGAVVSIFFSSYYFNGETDGNCFGVGGALAALIIVLAVFFSYVLQYFATDLEIKANKD